MPITSPDLEHKNLATNTAKELEAVGIIPTTPEDVIAHSPEESSPEQTDALRELGGEAVEFTRKFWEKNIVRQVEGGVTLFDVGDSGKAESMLEEKQEKEKKAA